MSMMTWTAPSALTTRTLSSTPTVAVTCWAAVCPTPKLRFDVFGTVPPGWMVRNEGLFEPVTVTFSTTAVASLGTPARPATWTGTSMPPSTGDVRSTCPGCFSASPSEPGRESNSRMGARGVKGCGVRGTAWAGASRRSLPDP
jgi:hypothetical protein